jgi:NADH dehydrogenase [ubiquinone] 1 alpha subcomplex assembly factor 7
MTALATILQELIATEGPMPLERYMGLCLAHPQFGYYMTRDPFGPEGDFITAPEVSQVFGELIGVWLAGAWEALGRPTPFSLIEMGPGRGTLMADVLKAARVSPGLEAALRVHLVEISPALRAAQRARLGSMVSWHDTLASVPDGPLVLLANELFDAIPIQQFERRDGRWCERCVGPEGLGLVPSAVAAAPAAEGTIIELAPQRQALARAIGQRLARSRGAALIIDYGHLTRAPGDTLQALRAHRPVPITDRPGESDITSHVDFAALGQALAEGGAQVPAALTQRDFLLAMGAVQRFARLAERADQATQALLQRQADRLLGEEEMGRLFKVMAAVSPGLAVPYPFGAP